jgi:CheY-like chemotaxis protein
VIVATGTILLVEDNPVDVLLIRRAMKQAQVVNPVQVVNDGDAAVQYLQGSDEYINRTVYPLPMLVLLDLKLPRRNGLEVLQWLREQPLLRRLPVVILTSSGETPDLERAYDLGVNSYLVKPVDFEALRHLIAALTHYWSTLNISPPFERR